MVTFFSHDENLQDSLSWLHQSIRYNYINYSPMLYIIAPDHTHLITGSVYPLTVFTDSLPTSHRWKLPVYSDFFCCCSPNSHILLLLSCSCYVLWTSQVALVVKNLPVNAGDGGEVGSVPGYEDPLEEGTATHSSILAWRIPWTEEPGEL